MGDWTSVCGNTAAAVQEFCDALAALSAEVRTPVFWMGQDRPSGETTNG